MSRFPKLTKVYECTVCSRRLETEGGFQDHFKQHAEEVENPYHPDTGHPGWAFQLYNIRVYAKILFRCGECDEVVENKYAHKRVHDGNKIPRKCSICGKILKSKMTFTHHMDLHKAKEKGEKYVCQICGMTFPVMGFLKNHLRYHSDERPHVCACGKRFKLAADLRRHSLIHNPVKPYICSYCGKGFSNDSNFRGHIRLHTGEKPYKCDVCTAAFTHKVSLKSHKKSVHGIDMWKMDNVSKAVTSNRGSTVLAHGIDMLKTEDQNISERNDADMALATSAIKMWKPENQKGDSNQPSAISPDEIDMWRTDNESLSEGDTSRASCITDSRNLAVEIGSKIPKEKIVQNILAGQEKEFIDIPFNLHGPPDSVPSQKHSMMPSTHEGKLGHKYAEQDSQTMASPESAFVDTAVNSNIQDISHSSSSSSRSWISKMATGGRNFPSSNEASHGHGGIRYSEYTAQQEWMRSLANPSWPPPFVMPAEFGHFAPPRNAHVSNSESSVWRNSDVRLAQKEDGHDTQDHNVQK